MTDDIVAVLRQVVRMCDHGWNLGSDWYPAPTECSSCVRQRQAADEIERLRSAGDALAKQITSPCRCVEAHDGAINETCAPCAAFFDWEDARRG